GGRPTSRNSPLQPSELPTRLWVLYDKADSLSLFTEGKNHEPASGSDVPVERVLVENPPRDLPPELPLADWPASLPVLVVHSPRAWGFVHPLQDRTLGQRVVRNWSALLRMVVPLEKNFVRAGGFDGNCLATNHGGNLWRVGDVVDWKRSRRITL